MHIGLLHTEFNPEGRQDTCSHPLGCVLMQGPPTKKEIMELAQHVVPTCRAAFSRKSAEIVGHCGVNIYDCPTWRKGGISEGLQCMHTELTRPEKVWN